jgi:hypothetical protein
LVTSGSLAGLGLLIPVLLAAVLGLQDITAFIMLAGLIGAGFAGRTWLAVPAAFAGFVLSGILVEFGALAVLGAHGWEEANAEHWRGNDPVMWKVLGQIMEYVIFGVLLAPFTALGVLLRRGLERRCASQR